MTSSRTLLLLLIIDFLPASVADDLFPQPAELQPDVDFWVDVFTNTVMTRVCCTTIGTSAVVYERLAIAEMTPDVSASEESRSGAKPYKRYCERWPPASVTT